MGERMLSTMRKRRENTSRFDIVRSEGVVFRVGLVRERYGRVRMGWDEFRQWKVGRVWYKERARERSDD
jgi:hypothetical protein